jgi:hypothetical protein
VGLKTAKFENMKSAVLLGFNQTFSGVNTKNSRGQKKDLLWVFLGFKVGL